MRGRLRAGSVAGFLVLGFCASCSRRNLEVGGSGTIAFDAGGLDAPDVRPPPNDGASAGDGPGGGIQIDAGESGGGTAAAALPWTASAAAPLRLDVAATATAVAVINR